MAMRSPAISPVNSRAKPHVDLRTVLGRFATGVTIVTTICGDKEHGMTANAFTSVSLSPPLILVSISKHATTCGRINESRTFAINILADSQEHLARRFAGQHRSMSDPFADLSFRRGTTGSPLLDGVVAWIDCSLFTTYDGGDHTLFLGHALEFGLDPTKLPLLFFGGVFRQQR